MTPRTIGVDDQAGFGRPPRRTRPRTKDRPDYSDAAVGQVVAVDRGRFTVALLVDGAERRVTATKARAIGRKGVIVGDDVRVVGDLSGDAGTLARVVEVVPDARSCAAPRTTTTPTSGPSSPMRTNSPSSRPSLIRRHGRG